MNLQEQISRILREEFQDKTDSVWNDSKKKLQKTFVFKDFNESMVFVNKISDIAEKQNHHPDIKINYNKVTLSITDHDKGGVSDKCYKFVDAVNKIDKRK